MKPRLKPRMFPEAGECLHDDRSFEEQMADLGVEIIRRKKEEVQVMDRENMGKTTHVQNIEERIDQLGLKGLLTVNQVISVPNEVLFALVEAGHTNTEMAERLDIGMVAVSRLRKYYNLGGKPGKTKGSAGGKEDADAAKVGLRAAYAAQKTGVDEAKEAEVNQVYEPVRTFNCQDGMVTTLLSAPAPLLDIADAGVVLSPLAAGVSKMLERIGDERVRLIITVERV